MKIYYFIACVFLILSCTNAVTTESVEKQETVLEDRKPVIDSIKEFPKLFVSGDFNGDKIIDTLREVGSVQVGSLQVENPYYNKWDDIDEVWGDDEKPYIYLVSNNKSIDTFRVGYGRKLYCLINIGDNDLDGRDEIAYVSKNNGYSYGVSPTDTAIANDCYIFKLSGNQWRGITSFRVNEKVFEKDGYVFNDIPGFLEKKNGTWMYLDYTKSIEDTTGKYKVMRKLKVKW